MEKLIVKNKISGGMKFLIIVLALYSIVSFFSFSVAQNAFLNFWNMFIKIIPILGIVFMVMILVNLFFTKERVIKHLGKDSGVMGWIYAIISGILVSGPPYILFPLLGDLKKSGMKNSLIAVFLYNRNVKIPFLPVTVYYFGLNFTIVLSFYIVIFSILNGKIVGRLVENKS